ncbi:peptide-methionine (S)-S-oxide reductase MsrA [Methylicorpusculum sp.]|uniref:peptide-methionine (S)-S-oxide reductase MsrA n=1 Tax=Methylicorpusculum sp. TaxID=2713644 RepID=UPI0027308BB4|nr:peptide-methionine (S)-S-oxide reductase MsrA [Methylicorpusculum sp.]MDP2180396.1 peptide-methionine (S)-S-oxide reductase MsrA [Methylicorpusculum sp.]MDP3530795.1 peptide-methionine (S)-S-oxide reductase MsrA [Methylicorpusculum sp.]MDZ4150365.1 peptide-methionine (S)-S-oxide reductase MsrA [Methylicorpusculum sp.]
MFSFLNQKLSKPSSSESLPGRDQPLPIINKHCVNGHPIAPPFPQDMQTILFGMGCFWGAERKFWQTPGVFSTAVGYSGGNTKNPTYEEVCSGLTGHSEVVLVVYSADDISFESLLKIFWESHNPTQGMRQGNDTGTQYRSCIYTYSDTQLNTALASKEHYQTRLTQSGLPLITTEIEPVDIFYYAETYHQQYLHKNPDGYCGLKGIGVCFES